MIAKEGCKVKERGKNENMLSVGCIYIFLGRVFHIRYYKVSNTPTRSGVRDKVIIASVVRCVYGNIPGVAKYEA